MDIIPAAFHTAMNKSELGPLAELVTGLDALLTLAPDEAILLATGARLLERLIAKDNWLGEAFTRPDPARYAQFPLYRDPGKRFSVASLVWFPGQRTPIHDHTSWGMVGILRGAELSQNFRLAGKGLEAVGEIERLEAGQIETISQKVSNIHQVSNAFDDRVSVSIHIYGADFGSAVRNIYANDTDCMF